jgi:hypothetical protein
LFACSRRLEAPALGRGKCISKEEHEQLPPIVFVTVHGRFAWSGHTLDDVTFVDASFQAELSKLAAARLKAEMEVRPTSPSTPSTPSTAPKAQESREVDYEALVQAAESKSAAKSMTAETRTTERPPEPFRDQTARLEGQASLDDAVAKGLLRRATLADANAWFAAAGRRTTDSSQPTMLKPYVVLKEFAYPAGLSGAHAATFFIPRNVPRPTGDPGHSTVYDFNTLLCEGTLCR